MDERLEQLAQEAASSLRDDPELAREVSEELRDHLADAVERYQADGLPPSAAVERALADFGSPIEVAARLQEANRGRMRLRGLISLGLRWLTVPAAIGIACWLAVLAVDDFVHFPYVWHSGLFWRLGGRPYDPGERLDLAPRQRLFVENTGDQEGQLQQQRAIWEASPHSVVYFANYAGYLVSSGRPGEEKLRELRRGFELDPENSRYDYLLAAVLVDEAVEVRPQLSDRSSLVLLDKIRFRVKDPVRFQQAMVFARQGLQKAHYRKYQLEMVEERLALFPVIRGFVDQSIRLGQFGRVRPESLKDLQRLALCAITCADLLYTEGRRDEARIYLRVPNDLARKLYQDDSTEVDLVTANRLAKIGKYAARVALDAGDEAAGAEIEEEASRLEHQLDKLRFEKPSPELVSRAGYMASFLLKALSGTVKVEDLKFSRETDYCLAEQAVLAVLLGFLFSVLLTSSVLSWLFGRASRHASAIPMLLIPRLKQLVVICVSGGILPVGAYFLFSRFSGLSGREYSLFPAWGLSGSIWFFLVQVSAVIIAVVLVSDWLVRRHVRRRCLELRVPVPQGWPSAIGRTAVVGATFGLMTLFTFIGLVTLGTWMGMEGLRTSVLLLGIALSLISLLAALLPLPALARAARNQPSYSLYYASLYRSRVPILALLIVLLAFLQPALSVYETWLVRHDPLMTRLTLETEWVKKVKRAVGATPRVP